MKYLNAADVLPKELLKELSVYVNGQLLYVPSVENKKSWGSKSGSKQYYEQRNSSIVDLHIKGVSIDELCEQFHLSYDTIRKIIKLIDRALSDKRVKPFFSDKMIIIVFRSTFPYLKSL